ncbi:hypothetical protein P3T23_001248 [Paraburkholderia sp. GAS448]
MRWMESAWRILAVRLKPPSLAGGMRMQIFAVPVATLLEDERRL